jgi:hypothetical protein
MPRGACVEVVTEQVTMAAFSFWTFFVWRGRFSDALHYRAPPAVRPQPLPAHSCFVSGPAWTFCPGVRKGVAHPVAAFAAVRLESQLSPGEATPAQMETNDV